jgi:hypothetical protein
MVGASATARLSAIPPVRPCISGDVQTLSKRGSRGESNDRAGRPWSLELHPPGCQGQGRRRPAAAESVKIATGEPVTEGHNPDINRSKL